MAILIDSRPPHATSYSSAIDHRLGNTVLYRDTVRYAIYEL